MQIPAFANGAYTSQSPNADCEKCVNWYPEVMESPGAKTQSVLYPCPGFASFLDLGNGPIRALWSENGRTFTIAGYKLYEIFASQTLLERGSVDVDGNPAQITSNGDAGGQLFIVSGNTGYSYDLTTNTLTQQITGATMCGFLDSYFIVLDANTSTIKISAREDGTTWDPTQVAQRIQGSDRLVAMSILHSDIWLMGSQTSEVWYNAGSYPFPFAPRPGAFLQQGTSSAFSLAALGPSLLWIGANDQGSGVVYRSDGYQPTRVSTHAIEFAIQSYGSVTDATAFSYQEQGHTFYVLNFPREKATWVYDAATNIWHERGYWDAKNSEFIALRVGTSCYMTGVGNLVGDRLTGGLYTMAVSNPLDIDGQGMRRQRRFRALSVEENYVFYSNLQFDMETGVGLSTGQGSDPQLMLSWSNDGGHTFSSEIWTSAGAQGNYSARAMFRGRLGRARNRVFDLIVSDPVPWRMNQAFVDVERGTW